MKFFNTQRLQQIYINCMYKKPQIIKKTAGWKFEIINKFHFNGKANVRDT